MPGISTIPVVRIVAAAKTEQNSWKRSAPPDLANDYGRRVRIGLINELHGRPQGPDPAPSWNSIAERARAAEEVGFDIFVFEDALIYRSESETDGVWESMAIAAALAAVTERIEIGQSVVNSPYRSPAMTASIATTLDEISGGRYVLGLGAGNTPDSDYEAFGFPTDKRYSRFQEAIQIIHSLLRNSHVDFEGNYYSARNSELVLRGPSRSGPILNIAAGGQKMIKLAARYGDQWNWWAWDESLAELTERLVPLIKALDVACQAEEPPREIVRTLDYYTILAPGFSDPVPKFNQPVKGSPDEIARFLLGIRDLGFSEVRVDVFPKTIEAIEAMAPVIATVHSA